MAFWRKFSPAIRVALLYSIFGIAWILASDTVVQTLAAGPSHHAWLQTYKGTFFVVSSALLIGALVFREVSRRSRLHRLLDEFVELSPDPVLVRRRSDDRILRANCRLADAFGVSADEVVGASLDDFDVDLDERTDRELRERIEHDGEVHNYRQTFSGPDGEFYALVSSRVIEFGDDELVCTVAKDITELVETYEETIKGWARALEMRDEETYAHALRVTEATVAVARRLDVPEEQIPHIRRGALLHDIGKLGVPDAILHKDGDLTDEEWAEIKRHPEYGRRLLEKNDFLSPAIDIPYCHHEQWDGSGYPRGLSGEDIPLAARIFAVVDVWDALLSDRPYRDAWPRPKVREHLRDNAGSHFEPELVDVFLEMEKANGDRWRDVDSHDVTPSE